MISPSLEAVRSAPGRAGLAAAAPFVLGGPVVLGAVLDLAAAGRSDYLGKPTGLAALAALITVPAVLAALAALMLPPLFIGGALLGRWVAAPALGAAALRSLRAHGLVLLGLAGPALVLLLTDPGLPALLAGGLVSAGGGLAALRVLSADLQVSSWPAAGRLFFYAWALVTLVLGAVLFLEHVEA